LKAKKRLNSPSSWLSRDLPALVLKGIPSLQGQPEDARYITIAERAGRTLQSRWVTDIRIEPPQVRLA
jgi:hypothetical protein